jgi:ABC-type proline/glycine betaine transport system ATPase subunit
MRLNALERTMAAKRQGKGLEMEVRVADVRKEFARFPALHNVSLDIRSGELIALLGPSGSGKTTLLRLIAGLETPTEGTIFFGEEDASQKSVQERNVGFVFQHYALFRHMTVADNIGFGLKVRPGSTRPATGEIRRRALELCSCRGLKSATQPSFRAASASASRLPAPWPSSRRFCFSTSLSVRSMRWCARNCAAGCVKSTTRPATPPFS